MIQGQENQIVRNGSPISSGAAAAPDRRHKQEALKDGPSTDQPESIQGRTGARSKYLADGKVKSDVEKSPKEVAAEQDRVSKVKVETKIEVGTS
jgi:hypothetical protein